MLHKQGMHTIHTCTIHTATHILKWKFSVCVNFCWWHARQNLNPLNIKCGKQKAQLNRYLLLLQNRGHLCSFVPANIEVLLLWMVPIVHHKLQSIPSLQSSSNNMCTWKFLAGLIFVYMYICSLMKIEFINFLSDRNLRDEISTFIAHILKHTYL